MKAALSLINDLYSDSKSAFFVFNKAESKVVFTNPVFDKIFHNKSLQKQLLKQVDLTSVESIILLSTKEGNVYLKSRSTALSSLGDSFYGIEIDFNNNVQTLENQLKKLSNIIEQTPSIVIAISKDQKVDYVNQKFIELSGYFKNQIVGKPLSFCLEGKNINFNTVLAEAEKNKEWKGDIVAVCKNRTVVLKANISVLLNEDQQTSGFVLAAEDITGLRDTEERLSLFLKNIDEVIYTVSYSKDESRKITFISPQIEKFIGINIDKINLENFRPSDYYYEKDKEKVKEFVRSIKASKKPGKLQYRSFNVKTQKPIWVELSLYPQLEANGFHYASFGIMRNISTQIEAENLLIQSELKHRMLFSKANDAILIMQDFKVFDCNEKTLEMFGADGFNKIVGKPLYQLMPEKQADGEDSVLKYHYLIQEAIKGNSHFFNWKHCKLDGSQFETEVSLNGFSVDENHFVQVIIRDITLRAEAELEKNRTIKSYFELFNSSSEFIFILNKKGYIIDVNDAVQKKYKTSKDKLEGVHIKKLEADKSAIDIDEKIQIALSEEYQKFDWWTVANKSNFPLELVLRQGSYFGKEVIILTGRDISERKNYENSIKESEQRFKLLSEASFEGIALTKNAKIIDVNDRFLKLYGFKNRKDIVGKTIFDITEESQHALIKERLKAEKNEPHEFVNYKQDGTKFIIESRAENIPYNGETIRVHVINDITLRKRAEQEKIRAELAEETARVLKKEIDERKAAEKKLFAAQEYSRNIIDSSIDMIISSDKSGKIIEFNQAAQKAFGYSKKELDGIEVGDLFAEENEGRKILEYIINKNVFSGEVKAKTKEGKEIPIYISAAKLKSSDGTTMGTMAVARDISSEKETQGKLRENIRQKEVLIKEVHHRVKNNLQVISSILNLQSSYVDDQQTLTILQECQDRIKSMAFIHESLYQSEDLAKVEFTQYLENLCNNLLFSYLSKNRTVKIRFDLEPTFLTLDTAIPCGLIVNELVSNSMKYAFKDKDSGKIRVVLKNEKDHRVVIVKDDGVGLPEGLDYRNTESLGLQLVVTLVDQIDGEIEYEYKDGAVFKINFKRD